MRFSEHNLHKDCFSWDPLGAAQLSNRPLSQKLSGWFCWHQAHQTKPHSLGWSAMSLGGATLFSTQGCFKAVGPQAFGWLSSKDIFVKFWGRFPCWSWLLPTNTDAVQKYRCFASLLPNWKNDLLPFHILWHAFPFNGSETKFSASPKVVLFCTLSPHRQEKIEIYGVRLNFDMPAFSHTSIQCRKYPISFFDLFSFGEIVFAVTC